MRSPELGDDGDRHGEGHPTHRLDRLDDRVEPPRLGVVVQFDFEALQSFVMVVEGADVLLEDNLLGRRGTDDLREPAQMSGSPVGAPGVADILAQQEGLQPALGGLQILEGILPGAGQIADRLVLDLGDVDRGQITRAHQAREGDRIAPVGLDPVTGPLGNQRRSHHEARDLLAPQVAIQPVPARSRLVNEHEVFALRLQLPDELVEIAVPRTDGSVRHSLRSRLAVDIGNRDRILVNIETHKPCASVIHG